MKPSKGWKLINKALEEESKEYAFKIYLSKFPHMSKDNYISFNDFYDQIKQAAKAQQQSNNQNKDEIMKEIKEITNKFKPNG